MTMILSAFVPSFMRILSQMAQDEVGQLLGMPREIEKLSRMIHQIQRVLIDAEGRQNHNDAINGWVMQLKDVMYDADDVIDLCRIKTDEERAQPGSSSSSQTSFRMNFLSCFRNPIFAHEISGKIKELNSRMNTIVIQIGLLGLIENRGASSDSYYISLKTHPVIVLSDLVGEKIEEHLEQLVELLTKDLTLRQRVIPIVGVIPIVAIEGMGGMGKTTLAKMVYNDKRIKAEFKLLIWICVSKELRPVGILQNVIREIGGDYGEAKEISEFIPILKQYIGRRKFFLVLDDIWPESEGVWYNLLRDPMIGGALGSKVLITTRNGRVSKRMRAIHTIKVNKLADEDGWSLLVKQVAPNGVGSEIHDLKEIGIQIVKKCDGLPLAIKSIGDLLCTKDNTRGNWQAVLRSNLWSMDGLSGDVHRAFYLSYVDLPPTLKQCFIFCSLFPKDYEFHKTNLIYMWLAEGFLQHKEDFWKLGNEYYMELLLRNLLEVTGPTHEQVLCKMHDLMWSFARHLGKDENFVLSEGQVLSRSKGSLKVRRLSIEGNEVNTEVIKKEKGLRTLLLLFTRKIALDGLFKAFSNLRILDLSSSNFLILPYSICDLVHLRYLNVNDSKICHLPNSIGNLKYLVYLNLAYCKDLSHVPRSIINLQELNVLTIYNSGVKAIPVGLNKLHKLVELHGFQPYKNNVEGFSSLDGIETLSQLIYLHLCSLEKVSDENIAKRANLQNKNRLRELKLFYTSLSWKDQVSQTNEKKATIEGVLNEFCPPRSLELLKIANYFGRYLPNWLNLGSILPNLKFLEISNCACIKGLAPLGQLPNLNILYIIGAYSVVSVGEEFLWGFIQSRDTTTTSCPTKPAFLKLSELGFAEMPNWKEWQWNKKEPAMRKLKKLFIRDCPQLKSLPEGLLHHATSLEYLDIMGADKLITIENLPSIKDIRLIRNPILEKISNLPSNSYILIGECPNLKVVNLKASQMMELSDYKMKILPYYLTMIMPQKLRIWCSEELLLKIAREIKSGYGWNKFKHIPKVTFKSPDESLYAIYQKTPFSFTTNISTRSLQR